MTTILSSLVDGLSKSPQKAEFARQLFERANDTLNEVLNAASLQQLVDMAFEHFTVRRSGRHKIAVMSIGDGGASGYDIVIVANDDMPFLVDSIVWELQVKQCVVHAVLHPILRVERDGDGELTRVLKAIDGETSGQQESFIAVVVDGLDAGRRESIAVGLESVLSDVRLAVTDWPAMLARLEAEMDALERAKTPIPAAERAETIAFCRWIYEGNFTFLGMREYRLAGDGDGASLKVLEKSGLGVLRDPGIHVLRRGKELVALTPEIHQFYRAPRPIIITKSNVVSRVHRRVHMDYIGLKTYDASGKFAGELRLVGLFTSTAYTTPASAIPVLRSKVRRVIENCGYHRGSFDGKALVNILDTFPRDELFQIGVQQLSDWMPQILDLEMRPRLRIFARVDRFDRFVSLIAYIPRDRYDSEIGARLGAMLEECYAGVVVASTPFFNDTLLVRVHYILARYEGVTPDIPTSELERRAKPIVQTWPDRLVEAIAGGLRETAPLARKYQDAFPVGYAETFSIGRAMEDIKRIERLGPDRSITVDFYRLSLAEGQGLRCAVYKFDEPLALSERVPVLENFGFRIIDERSYRLHPMFAEGSRQVCLHDMALEFADSSDRAIEELDEALEDGFVAVQGGFADNDAFNKLVVSAGLHWRMAAVLRSYAAYLRQIRSPHSPEYIAAALNANPAICRLLVRLFQVRFDPEFGWDALARSDRQSEINAEIEAGLGDVASLDHDRILRQIVNLIGATARTNFYQTGPDGRVPETVTFKFMSKQIEGLIEPRPFREMWVSGPRVEGIHLRFAPIARGGLRWSDRAQDFRTEVLGLAKAQQVKNTVIVPQGAKGGFVPRQLGGLARREDVQAEGIAAYKIFVSALLDLTDNVVGGEIVPPAKVVRHDGDDPYLVVAADKGTATFSDFANAISLAKGHWLGDAFASGGSAGYDHKKMGITARGAWECVKRHFREMDVDIQATPFSVVGVGDMSGDVFGNGMLLSPQTCLVAAFDHRDIFIDPNPDLIVSFAERMRLFELDRSSWQDYDRRRLSSGGGVFSRSAKKIQLTPAIRARLGINSSNVTPNELIRAVLKAPVDLIWFGGIGTYIRAGGESNEAVADRANDDLRITVADVRAKVIGEGANIGITQSARIEYAAAGGRINADFIDNSAGVSSSDQEVNIKIALADAIKSGALDASARNDFLASLTDDVAAACLRDNYQQSLAISLADTANSNATGELKRLLEILEERGFVDRKLEGLPSDTEIATRVADKRGFVRPEIAVLMCYAKIALVEDLMNSDLPRSGAYADFLLGYFPERMQERFGGSILDHQLGPDIVAMRIANSMINRGGPAIAVRLMDETGRDIAEIANAVMAVRAIFSLPELWAKIDDLDGRISGDLQLELYAATREVLVNQASSLLREGGETGLSGLIDAYSLDVKRVCDNFLAILPKAQRQKLEASAKAFEEGGVPSTVALEVARLEMIFAVPFAKRLSVEFGRPISDCLEAVYDAADHLRIEELRSKFDSTLYADYFDQLAVRGAVANIERAVRTLARHFLASQPDVIGSEAGEREMMPLPQRIAKAKAAIDELLNGSEPSVSRLTITGSAIRDLAGT